MLWNVVSALHPTTPGVNAPIPAPTMKSPLATQTHQEMKATTQQEVAKEEVEDGVKVEAHKVKA